MDCLSTINTQIYSRASLIHAALESVVPALVQVAAANYKVRGVNDIRGEFLEQISRLYISYTLFNFDKESRDWLEDYVRGMTDSELSTIAENNIVLLTYIATNIRSQITATSAIFLIDQRSDTKCTWTNTLLLYSYYEYMCKIYILLRAHYTESVTMTALNPVFNRFISKFVGNNPEILIMFLESNAIPYLKHNGENILIYKSLLMSPVPSKTIAEAACRAGVVQYLGRVISANKLKTKVMSKWSIIKSIISSRSRAASRVSRD